MSYMYENLFNEIRLNNCYVKHILYKIEVRYK